MLLIDGSKHRDPNPSSWDISFKKSGHSSPSISQDNGNGTHIFLDPGMDNQALFLDVFPHKNQVGIGNFLSFRKISLSFFTKLLHFWIFLPFFHDFWPVFQEFA